MPIYANPPAVRVVVQYVVVISQPHLGDVQRSLGRPLANIDRGVDRPEELFDPTGGFSLESVGKCGEEITFCIFQICRRMCELSLVASFDEDVKPLCF